MSVSNAARAKCVLESLAPAILNREPKRQTAKYGLRNRRLHVVLSVGGARFEPRAAPTRQFGRLQGAVRTRTAPCRRI